MIEIHREEKSIYTIQYVSYSKLRIHCSMLLSAADEQGRCEREPKKNLKCLAPKGPCPPQLYS